MTEYDYSPEAYERFMESQNKIARWVNTTNRVYPDLRNPFDPATPAPDIFLELPNGRYRDRGTDWGAGGSYKDRERDLKREQGREKGVYNDYRAKEKIRPRTHRSSSHSHHTTTESRPPPVRSQTTPMPPHTRRASYDYYAATTTAAQPQKHTATGSKYDLRSGSRYDLSSNESSAVPRRSAYAIYDYSQHQARVQPATTTTRRRSSSVARTYPPATAPATPARPPSPPPVPPPPQPQRPKPTRTRSQTLPPPRIYHPIPTPPYPRYPPAPVYPHLHPQQQQQAQQVQQAQDTHQYPTPPHSAPVQGMPYPYPAPRRTQHQHQHQHGYNSFSHPHPQPVIPPPVMPVTKPPPLLKRLFTGLTGSKQSLQSPSQSQSQSQSPESPTSTSTSASRSGILGRASVDKDREDSRPRSGGNFLRKSEREREREREKEREKERERGREREREREDVRRRRSH